METEKPEFHFYASSVATWATTRPGRDLRALIKLMEKEGYNYSLFYVPLPHDAVYEIKFYTPHVKDLVWLGHYEVKKARHG
jgi:hypothetical protein